MNFEEIYIKENIGQNRDIIKLGWELCKREVLTILKNNKLSTYIEEEDFRDVIDEKVIEQIENL